MNKHLLGIALFSALLMTSASWAQLPSNPWAPQPTVEASQTTGPRQQLAEANAKDVPEVPTYDNILPVDPWARARVNNGKATWRGSGRNDRGLNYVGEATTYGDAMGQEMIAPEVNRHNMLVMTEHLRKMGYKIPESYDQKIRDMPQAYAKYLRSAYDKVNATSMEEDPLSALFSGVMHNVEGGTGLDFENILFNTIDVLSTD